MPNKILNKVFYSGYFILLKIKNNFAKALNVGLPVKNRYTVENQGNIIRCRPDFPSFKNLESLTANIPKQYFSA